MKLDVDIAMRAVLSLGQQVRSVHCTYSCLLFESKDQMWCVN